MLPFESWLLLLDFNFEASVTIVIKEYNEILNPTHSINVRPSPIQIF